MNKQSFLKAALTFTLLSSSLPLYAMEDISETKTTREHAMYPRIFKPFVEEATRINETLSFRQKIGQMIMVGFKGTMPEDRGVAEVAEALRRGEIGGLISYRYNIVSPEQCQSLNHFFMDHSFRGLPPFLSLDQEGGKVMRLPPEKGFKGFMSAQEVARTYTSSGAQAYYQGLAHEVYKAGYNFNFGPVADVNVNAESPAIGKLGRSFSADPTFVTDYCAAFIQAHEEVGILSTAKHTPGHGSAKSDSHHGLTDITDTYKRDVELAPYFELQKRGLLSGVMTAHVFHRKLDAEYPATLSETIIQDILRQEIGFQGLCVTDALDMGAIVKEYSFEKALLRAIKAGNDILLYSSNPAAQGVASYEAEGYTSFNATRYLDVIESFVKEDATLKPRIEEAAHRILMAKLYLASKSSH